MGFFSSKVTYVASTAYNLAGDVDRRPSYLKTTLIGSVVGNSNSSVAESFNRAYMEGPGIRLRRFFSWAEKHYGMIGVPTGSLGSSMNVDAAVIEDQIPGEAGKTVRVQRVNAGTFEAGYFAEQWMMENHPTLLGTLWQSDIDDAGQITITFEDLTTSSFTPVTSPGAVYIYAIYSLVDDATDDWGDAKMFIYKVGSGNAVLDQLVYEEVDDGEYVPFIPVRIENQFLSTTYQPAAYQLAKKAYKKIMGGKFDDIVEKLADNEQLNEIDHAYVMFGVPLNVKERASREYLFRFFDKCRVSQTADGVEYALQQEANAAYLESIETWNIWKAAQSDPAHELYGTPEPERLYQPGGIGSEVHIKSQGSFDTKLDIKITWGAITETHGTGQRKPGARKGEIWIVAGTDNAGSETTIYSGGSFLGVNLIGGGAITINWQVTADSWKSLTITGLKHTNLIYKNKSVVITAAEAMADTEESGFIVPLHMATVREMRLVDSTQMMTACAYMVLNSYKVVKKKWYQTGWFSVLLFVVLVVITIVVFGPAAPGVLGTALSVGASLGLTGLAAVIAGAVINALAGMIISKLIMMGATEIFGAKWGALIGTIVSMATMATLSGVSSGMTLSQIGGQLASAQNLMQLSSAIGNGISGYLAGATQEVYAQTKKLEEEAKRKAADLSEQFAQEFGYDRAYFDPMRTTDTIYGSQFTQIESADDFLTRTLLTGGDIAEMSMDMVSSFTRRSLKLPLVS